MASTKRAKKRHQKSLKATSFPYTQLTISLTLLVLGAGVMLYAAFQKVAFWQIPKAPTSRQEPAATAVKPSKLYIPNMDRVLYVSDGYAQGNRWTVSETGVSYLTTSSLPQEAGNTVIYGHNRQGILGGLWRVHEGDYLYVILQDGQFVKYQVAKREEIKPTQVEILNQTDDSRLTLYTCSGFLDTARFVIVAQKVESSYNI